MKARLVIEDGSVTVELTPEGGAESAILAVVGNAPSVTVSTEDSHSELYGSFYSNRLKLLRLHVQREAAK